MFVKFPALLINHMVMIVMTKEIITSLYFLLKKLISPCRGTVSRVVRSLQVQGVGVDPDCKSTGRLCRLPEQESCSSQGSSPPA